MRNDTLISKNLMCKSAVKSLREVSVCSPGEVLERLASINSVELSKVALCKAA